MMRKQILLIIFLIVVKASFSQMKPDFTKLDDAVVVVLIYDFKGDLLGHGSGFVIDAKGTVVTNYHVIEDAYKLKVRIDKNGLKSDYDIDKILSGNQESDIALISIKNSTPIDFQFLTLAKTLPKKGDQCWSIGTPADIQYMNTVSEGIISNIYLDGIETWRGQMLQVSAPFSHGSSGGPLVNSKGEVIGVTCGGGENKDEARANINWAVAIGELNSLSSINRASIVDPSKTPCQLSFYTNSKYTDNVYLYINSYYVGTFTKYFDGNYTPTCGEEGTITRFLTSGTHSYEVYFASQKQVYRSSITLNPGECQTFKIGGSSPEDERIRIAEENSRLEIERSEMQTRRDEMLKQKRTERINAREEKKLIIGSEKYVECKKSWKMLLGGVILTSAAGFLCLQKGNSISNQYRYATENATSLRKTGNLFYMASPALFIVSGYFTLKFSSKSHKLMTAKKPF